MTNKKEHWETIYQNKQPNEVSWTQEVPQISLDFIHALNLPKSAKIIDIGGGESKLVDFLLNEGFENISVLDISSIAIEKAKKRLGSQAAKVNWIVSDILDFNPVTKYDCWHDRAAFHFLIAENDIKKYVELTNNYVNKYLVIGTFSTHGPTRCSGLDITQYADESMEKTFEGFHKLDCKLENHYTPFNTRQSFLFCSFEKRNPI